LWATAVVRGYASGLWATYHQWQQLGAQVRKGEESTVVVFWKFDREEESQTAEETESGEQRSIVARAYHVFNAAQLDGFTLPPIVPFAEAERIEAAESFFRLLGPEIRHGGNRAFYCVGQDYIQLPPFELFRASAAYYATLAHECVHWTGAPHRLNRDLKPR